MTREELQPDETGSVEIPLEEKVELSMSTKKKEKTINIFEAEDMDAVSKMIYNLR